MVLVKASPEEAWHVTRCGSNKAPLLQYSMNVFTSIPEYTVIIYSTLKKESTKNLVDLYRSFSISFQFRLIILFIRLLIIIMIFNLKSMLVLSFSLCKSNGISNNID